jgi:putative DNA-invertase from lambdoid prophage Rac
MLAVFAEFERDILRDRVKAGIAQARKEGRPHGRPSTMQKHAAEIRSLFADGISKRQIAKNRLCISRDSVRRMLPLQTLAPRARQLRGRKPSNGSVS